MSGTGDIENDLPVNPENEIGQGNNVGAEEDDELLVPTELNAKGERMGPVSAIITHRKEAKAAKAEVARLTAEIQKFAGVQQQLEALTPLMQRIQEDPSILDRARQPRQQEAHQDDAEARELAEDMGFIDATGALDVTRARRFLDRMEQRAGRMVDQRVAPLAQTTHQQTANHYRMGLKAARGENGAPLVTPETVDELFAMLPPELAGNEEVAKRLLIPMALGMDRLKGRTPKAPPALDYGDPLFTEAAGGRRGSVLTDQDKTMAKQVGVEEGWLAKKSAEMFSNGRRGVALE